MPTPSRSSPRQPARDDDRRSLFAAVPDLELRRLEKRARVRERAKVASGQRRRHWCEVHEQHTNDVGVCAGCRSDRIAAPSIPVQKRAAVPLHPDS